MSGMPFIKMHGAGNDFVVLDGRARALDISPAAARAIGDRHKGVGFDQLILIQPDDSGMADAHIRFLNADGSESAACGNGTRCVAALLMSETGKDHVVLETETGLLDAEARPDGRISVDMGPAKTEWQDIPLADAMDTLHLPISEGPLADPVGVGMGNPHAVFFVDDAAKIDLARLGAKLERHSLFPERANIGIAQVLAPDRLRLRVWERGVGITLACGSGACAALVAAVRRNLAERKAAVVVDGGELEIEWLEDGHVLMTGPVAHSFAGTLDAALINGTDA